MIPLVTGYHDFVLQNAFVVICITRVMNIDLVIVASTIISILYTEFIKCPLLSQ